MLGFARYYNYIEVFRAEVNHQVNWSFIKFTYKAHYIYLLVFFFFVSFTSDRLALQFDMGLDYVLAANGSWSNGTPTMSVSEWLRSVK